MYITRDYVKSTAKKEVENFISSCQQAGVDIIEICYSEITASPPKINGFEVPITHFKGTTTRSSELNVTVGFETGSLFYHPDKNGRCWGYVAATEKNLEKIKRNFARNWFWIVDKKIESELKKQAAEEGLPTDPVGGVLKIKRNKREVELEKHNSNLNNKITELQERLERLQRDKEDASDRLKNENEKRLKNVKIKDRKKAIENIKNMRESE